MAKSIEDVKKLIKSWEQDPEWDLSETEGFEEYRFLLQAYQEKKEREWELERKKREEQINEEARKLGVEGLYRIILRLSQRVDKHDRAMWALCSENTILAADILRRDEDDVIF